MKHSTEISRTRINVNLPNSLALMTNGETGYKAKGWKDTHNKRLTSLRLNAISKMLNLDRSLLSSCVREQSLMNIKMIRNLAIITLSALEVSVVFNVYIQVYQ